MSVKSFSPAERLAAIGWAREDLYAYTRWMFLQRKGYKWLRAQHHERISEALMRVFRGECKRLIINVPPRYSKAIDCDTPMWTPAGWARAGDIAVGDRLLGSDGHWTTVVGVHPQGVKPAFDVRFTDGSLLVACGDHRWAVRLRDKVVGRDWTVPWRVKTTDELRGDLHEADGRRKWRIPVLRDTNNVDADLPLDPYLLGCWLGDGTTRCPSITTMDPEIVSAFAAFDPKPYAHQNGGRATIYGLRRGFSTLLRSLGVLGNKHIPQTYMHASHRQRLALLQGLCDTDGWVAAATGQQGICFSNERLSDDVRALICSLGGTWRGFTDQPARGRPSHKTFFQMPAGDVAFRLPRKVERINPRAERNTPRRFVASIEPVAPREMVCFTVDAADHLFCAGRDFVVTHNTEMAVVNFISWSMGHVPDAEYIHASYSSALATNNSTQIRAMVQHEAYQEIFPDLQLASDAQHHWKTAAGGVMYAAGAGGTITGFGAGKMRDGFGGCFPVGTRVWTESGLIPIDRIVRERMAIKVWAFDYAGGMALRPVVAWHENPPNDIWRVTFDDGAIVECTPDHRFWTNRGWVRADSLGVDDRLPRVNGGVQGFNHIGINPERGSGGLDPAPVLPSCSVGPIGDGEVSMAFGQYGSEVGLLASAANHGLSACDGLPCVAAPDLVDDANADAVLSSQIIGCHPDSVVDGQGPIIGEDGNGVDFGLAESAVLLAVDDVGAARVVAQVDAPVVRWVAISMADVRSVRALANEGQHHKRVNGRVTDLGIPGQTDAKVPAAFPVRLEQLSGLRIGSATSGISDHPAFASDPSVVADGVEPFVSGHRKPVLVERVRHDDVTFCLTVDGYHNFTIESGLVVKNCIVIDDPHKADEARSDVVRKGVIDWFQNTIESRKNSPDTPIILIMQRLHEKDLAGWLLDGGNGEKWEHVCLPAIQADGTALWPEKHDIETLRRMERAAPYVFAGQYLQRPAPPEGGIIKPDNIQTIDALPAIAIEWARGWDFGSTSDGDYTAGGKLGRLPDGRFVIGDMVRLRTGPDERDAALANTASRDGREVKISIPQDPGQAGKTQALYLTRQLAGYPVHSSPESGDKVTRAEPLAAQINIGNVLMLRGPWNAELINEMRMFPNGNHDDQVDSLSRAFEQLMGSNTGMLDWMRQQAERAE